MMLLGLDHLIVAVSNLEAATVDWTRLLGRAASWHGAHPGFGTRNALFRLDGFYLELLAADAPDAGFLAAFVCDALGEREERPFGMALAVHDIEATVAGLRARGVGVLDAADGQGIDSTSGVRRTWRSAFIDPATVRGLRLLLIEHTSGPELLPTSERLGDDPSAECDDLDHAVVFTEDLDASRALWVDRMGLAVAWSRDFPDRGTRNLGLALGGVVLELIQRTDRAPRERPDTLWGAAWRVRDCARAASRLRAAGIPVDQPRDGLLPGTLVATVRWRRTPTLLLEVRSGATPSGRR